jgi:hypothetical protein
MEEFTARTGMWHEGYTYDYKKRQSCLMEFELYNPSYVYFRCGASDWEKFLTVHGLTDKFPLVLRYHLHGEGNSLSMVTDRHSYRDPSSHIEWDSSNVSWQWNGDHDEHTVELLDKLLYDEIEALAEIVKGIVKAEFDQLLDNLTEEYEYRTSEEFVRDDLEQRMTDDELMEWAIDNDEYEKLTWKSQPYTLTEQQSNGAQHDASIR